MLKRKITQQLIDWKTSSEKAMLVTGARQIGKSYAIREFAKQEYQTYVEINLYDNKAATKALLTASSMDDFLSRLSLFAQTDMIPGNTLIFIDEVQEAPDIMTMVKFLVQDGRFDYIFSGSMLGTEFKGVRSYPVGYVTKRTMRPMDFEEFLWAKGYSKETRNDFLEHMRSLKPFNELEMSVYLSLFMEFCILGGMPAVIREYIEKGTFEGSLDTQRQLLADYREDIRKYAEGMDQARILNVFQHIPVQLAKDNKKFQISKVASGARFKDYRGCIEWLNDAGIINVCYCLSFPELPLKGNYDEEKYKIYLADTGLLVAMLDEEVQEDLRVNRNLGVYKGALYENVVGEALVKAGYDLYYFKKENSTLEEDFFVRTAEALVPVEVKASNNRSKSLRTLIDSEHYPDIHFGIKLAGTNIGYGNGVYTFPYFCSFLLKEYLRGFQHLENKS